LTQPPFEAHEIFITKELRSRQGHRFEAGSMKENVLRETLRLNGRNPVLLGV
jgi:hypothetical protein